MKSLRLPAGKPTSHFLARFYEKGVTDCRYLHITEVEGFETLAWVSNYKYETYNPKAKVRGIAKIEYDSPHINNSLAIYPEAIGHGEAQLMNFGPLNGMNYIQFEFGPFLGERRLTSGGRAFAGRTVSNLFFLDTNKRHRSACIATGIDEIDLGEDWGILRLTEPAAAPEDVKRMRNYLRRKFAPKSPRPVVIEAKDIPF